MNSLKLKVRMRLANALMFIGDIVKRTKYKYINFTNYAHLQKFGRCGSKVILFGSMDITGHSNINIGENVFVGENAKIQGGGGLTIGDNVVISRNVTIYTLNHDWRCGCIPYGPSYLAKKVEICSNVWIGMNVAIRPGVKIGEGAIIGMNTVVLKDVAPLSIVNMHGATVEKERNLEEYNRAISSGNIINFTNIVDSKINTL